MPRRRSKSKKSRTLVKRGSARGSRRVKTRSYKGARHAPKIRYRAVGGVIDPNATSSSQSVARLGLELNLGIDDSNRRAIDEFLAFTGAAVLPEVKEEAVKIMGRTRNLSAKDALRLAKKRKPSADQHAFWQNKADILSFPHSAHHDSSSPTLRPRSTHSPVDFSFPHDDDDMLFLPRLESPSNSSNPAFLMSANEAASAVERRRELEEVRKHLNL